MERDVTVRLPGPLYEAALRLARQRDETLGRVIREALAAEIGRQRNGAKSPNRADEQLLGPLRVLLAADLAEARSWDDLRTRLRDKGFALHPAGGGLALHSHPDGTRLCKASELGQSYVTLMRRFGRPFPGHPHRRLAEPILPPVPRQEEDDFDVIDREPFRER
ncbi:hypothetical protein [Salipiger abyssi]|uniref:Uncharacterized protein n=1 Tax=Salipiger abyssi TaxID=1250539 RepID=A0A1P8USS6_9RHOB|nr:hypothetical protein [Salipiger abyssi]APZ52398.1 hypothetical protein Ga0080574_TMP2064 [Salipiger abyssi]